MDRYLFDGKGEWISYDEAVTDLLRAVGLPKGIKSKPRNYMGQRIRDAARHGKFHKVGAGKGAQLERVPFTRWALEVWPELRGYIRPFLEIENVDIRIESSFVRLEVSVPTDYDELAEHYVRVVNELAATKKQLRMRRAELADFKKKRHTLHLKQKAAGQKGGRPKK